MQAILTTLHISVFLSDLFLRTLILYMPLNVFTLSRAKSDYEKEMIIFTIRVAVIKPNIGIEKIDNVKQMITISNNF